MTTTLIKAWIQPTEDPEKVTLAIRNLFGNIDLEARNNLLSTKLEGLERLSTFRDKIIQDRIRDTLKRVFTRWQHGDELSFGLNRQAAYVGHVSLNLENEDPMGPVQVVINGDVENVISFLCEKSRQ